MSKFLGKHAERLREIANTEEYKAAERDVAIEAAREWSERIDTSVHRGASLKGKEHVDALLDEIDWLRKELSNKPRAEDYAELVEKSKEKGYNDAIEAAVGRCHAVSRNQRVAYPWLLNVPMDELLSEQCAAEIAALRRGGSGEPISG